MSLFLVCFNPEHAACFCQGCIIFSVLLLALFFLILKESSYDYTRNIPLKKGECLAPITEITAVEMGEEENAKSHQWWKKAACETGLETGSTASLGTWKAKQNPEAPVLQLVHTQSEPLVCGSSALWLHHTAPFNSSTANAAWVFALTLLPTRFLHLINISWFQHSGLIRL